MEVPNEDETQTVLLEGMEGAQYITIQRADGEALGKGVPLFALSGELISDGMVVDMINAGVGSDYNTATQYYETDDLLPHVLTEVSETSCLYSDTAFSVDLEDRKLAAALVAVQLQQQQKQQQIHAHTHQDDPTLSNVTHLETLPPVNSYTMQTIQGTDPPPVYPLQQYKQSMQQVKQEFINVKCEQDIDVSAESSEDAVLTPGMKRSLPHKKRIPRKLKQQSKKSASRKDLVFVDASGKLQPINFKCQLCGNIFTGQLKFFEHLKVHYEPVKEERKIQTLPVSSNIMLNIPESSLQPDENHVEEFSEPEDIMEGIRDVVEESGANTDEDNDDTNGPNNDPAMWTISEVAEHIEQEQASEPLSIIEDKEKSVKEPEPKVAEPPKKKKASKPRKSTDELTCPHCERSFHHKNSLVYHMRSHSGERPHQCEVCGKSFFAASALKVHKRLHSGDKPYKCEDCGRHFRQWGDLKYHSTSLHSEQKQFQCEYCGKDFARKYSLIVHRRIHTGEKNYRCEYCSKTFRASSYLQNHRRIHTGEKPHPCTICGKPFRVRSDMKRHMLTHSRGRAERPTKSANKSSEGSERKNKARTINDLVQELKLEVEPSATVVKIVRNNDENPESILPHEGGQSCDYTITTTTNESATERDPLEEVVPTTDHLNYFFI